VGLEWSVGALLRFELQAGGGLHLASRRRGRWADWIRLDLQGGVQHESNGKSGADSRSLNLAYLRTTITFGRVGRFQVSVSPKAFVYLGELSDNPDLADYRGYAELRAVLGWSDNVQLAAIGRVGTTSTGAACNWT